MPLAADLLDRHAITSLSQVVMVPVDKYPTYNFVGRILGPRGMTVRQLEEETGCKIMVRGRGSIKGKIRDRGSEGEPLHVLIQCDDYPDRAKEKMSKAVNRVNELLTPPPDGKDELKRKQLVELAIINGTYRPTNATRVALQNPSPLDAGHLATEVDHTLTQRKTLKNSLSGSMMAAPLHQSINYSNIQAGGVHQATLQEYLDATALLNSVPSFVHDGSGDGPKK